LQIEQEVATLFQDQRHPLGTQLGSIHYQGFFDVYHTHPSERVEAEVKKVPRFIRLTFSTTYNGVAASSWSEEGFFGNDSTDWTTSKLVYLSHEILFEPDSLMVGEYTFDLGDTADSRRRISLEITSLGWPQNSAPTLRPLELKGTIAIQKVFTKNSGKFTYSLDATYSSGQKSSFQGTVEFRGVRKEVDCGSMVVD